MCLLAEMYILDIWLRAGGARGLQLPPLPSVSPINVITSETISDSAVCSAGLSVRFESSAA